MGFMRSLYAGISGLRNHQTMMDVAGNNISNVNTSGFKAGRVSFSETFAQTLRGTTSPISNVGGTNPMQIGLGVSIAQIDTLFSQGNIETTGQTTDLALQGDGFFVVRQGDKRFYTRAGAFQFDADGTLNNPGNGAIVQGYMADSNGRIPADASIDNIVIPYGQKSPANATSQVTYTGNLDASAPTLGTILQTEKLYAVELPTQDTDMDGAFASNAAGTDNRIISSMISGSSTVTLTINGSDTTFTYSKTDASVGNRSFTSVQDLMAEINSAALGVTVAMNAADNGALQVTNTSGAAINIQAASTNPSLTLALNTINNSTMANGATALTYRFHHPASETDLMTDLVNKSGTSLNTSVGENITIDGIVGGSSVTQGTLAIAATTTFRDYRDIIATTLGLTNNEKVTIERDGSLRVTGDGGKVYELSELNIQKTPAGTSTEFNAIFDSSVGNYQTRQEATDAEHVATIPVYDSLGNEHTVSLKFIKNVRIPNEWLWEATVASPASMAGTSTGRINFATDGSLDAFEFDDGSTALQINPGNGVANLVSAELNVGELGSIDGITQFSRSSNAVASSQDGYKMGLLERLSIGRNGEITGTFTNGINQTMAQLGLATFNNPGGLIRIKDGMFDITSNSGTPIVSTAGNGIEAEVISGALEQSNVDLAEEFTKLIVAQRGFQASSRVITTSDEFLQEINSLKR
jgi:flagellar hook protein FlgE